MQMGGVYCWVSLASRLRRQEDPAIQMGGVLLYKLEVYCRTFFETSRVSGSGTLLILAPSPVDFGKMQDRLGHCATQSGSRN